MIGKEAEMFISQLLAAQKQTAFGWFQLSLGLFPDEKNWLTHGYAPFQGRPPPTSLWGLRRPITFVLTQDNSEVSSL